MQRGKKKKTEKNRISKNWKTITLHCGYNSILSHHLYLSRSYSQMINPILIFIFIHVGGGLYYESHMYTEILNVDKNLNILRNKYF